MSAIALTADELRIDRADQHASFVAGADHAHANRLGDRLAVAEIQLAQAVARRDIGLDRLFEQLAADRLAADGGVEIFLADRSLLGT